MLVAESSIDDVCGQMIQFMSLVSADCVVKCGRRKLDISEGRRDERERERERNRFDKSEAIKHIWIKDPHKLFGPNGKKIKEKLKSIQRAVECFY